MDNQALAQQIHAIAHGSDNCAYGGRGHCFVWRRFTEEIDTTRHSSSAWIDDAAKEIAKRWAQISSCGLKEAAEDIKASILKYQYQVETCTWTWTPEGGVGFWEAQCKQDEDWPISLLHEGAKFCAFCGNPLIVEGEA